jgi:hypothetical protein
MREERCLSENTIKHRLYLLQGFCDDVAQHCNSLSSLTPIIIDSTLLKKRLMDFPVRQCNLMPLLFVHF